MIEVSASLERLWSDLTAPGGLRGDAGRDGTPKVCLNMVMSADGATTIAGRVGALTSPIDQALLRRLRGEADAVLVGARTVRTEGYGALLGAEDRRARVLARGAPEPLLCVVSQSLAIPEDAPVLGEAPSPLVFLTPSHDPLPAGRRQVQAIRSAPVSPAAPLELRPLLERLAGEFGVRTIVCEGGPTLNAALFAENLVEELFLSLSPVVAQQAESPMLVAGGGATLELELVAHSVIDSFVFLRYRRQV